MKLTGNLFHVLACAPHETGFVTTLKLNPDHIIFSGHFPGHPVTPGVIQLQIVHELSENHFQTKLKLVSVPQCKFLKILNPEETNQLDVKVDFIKNGKNLQITARGENSNTVFFKLNAVYQLD